MYFYRISIAPIINQRLERLGPPLGVKQLISTAEVFCTVGIFLSREIIRSLSPTERQNERKKLSLLRLRAEGSDLGEPWCQTKNGIIWEPRSGRVWNHYPLFIYLNWSNLKLEYRALRTKIKNHFINPGEYLSQNVEYLPPWSQSYREWLVQQPKRLDWDRW